MRLLKIALIVFISSSLLAYYSDPVVAATSSKSSKNSSHHGQKAHGRSKGKKRASKTGPSDVWERIRLGLRIPRPSPAADTVVSKNKNVSLASSGSMAETIKTTGTIPSSKDESSKVTTDIAALKLVRGESQLPEKLRVRQVLMPSKSSSDKLLMGSEEKYTRLGRLKFGAKKPSTDKLSSGKNDHLFKSPSVQRIRTRLGLHPELFKQGDVVESSLSNSKTDLNGKTKVQRRIAIGRCADINKQAVISQAQQGLLPESYYQMAEQCRIKQNANYERLSRHIAGYSQRKGLLYQVSERARPYLFHIVDALNKYNLPLDLALLPIVESAYQATALSNKDAAGIWQFIPSTGREYGLQQNESYDGRLDVTASTQAAIKFLSGLNAHFKGDWLLALAAYNSGQGTVDAAISRNRAEGIDTDFWSLDLPAETQDYVPRLLALSAIFSNPGSYGIKLRPVRNETYFIKVNIDRETDINQLLQKDLKAIAKLADFDPGEFGLLNAAYLKPTLTERKPFTLLMPISNANQLHQSLAFMAQSYKDEKRAGLGFISGFVSLPSESAGSKTEAPLLSISLNRDTKWFPTLPLATTVSGEANPMAGESAKANMGDGNWGIHYLDKGESLKALAEYHGISEEKLRGANKLKRRQSISLGQRLFVPLKKVAEASMSRVASSILFKGVGGNLDSIH